MNEIIGGAGGTMTEPTRELEQLLWLQVETLKDFGKRMDAISEEHLRMIRQIAENQERLLNVLSLLKDPLLDVIEGARRKLEEK